MLTPLFNHLWQSTLFAAVAGILTLALRKNHARVRHALWLAASIKFLIPISLLIALGNAIPWRSAHDTMPSNFTVAIDQVSQPFTPPRALLPILPIIAPPEPSPWPAVLLAGAAAVSVVGPIAFGMALGVVNLPVLAQNGQKTFVIDGSAQMAFPAIGTLVDPGPGIRLT